MPLQLKSMNQLQPNKCEATFEMTWPSQSNGKGEYTFQLCSLLSITIQECVEHIGVDTRKYNYEFYHTTTYIKMSKIIKDDPLSYSVDVNKGSHLFVVTDKLLPKVLIDTSSQTTKVTCKYEKRISVTIELLSSSTPTLEKCFTDTEFTDLKLIGEDGFIEVHRLFLANCSTVMKTMLTGEWKETKEGQVKIPATVKTLTHFKEYIYLDKLPDGCDDLEHLLSLGYCYQISDLVQKCLVKLVFNFKPENFFKYVELAQKYKSKLLLKGIQSSLNFDSLFLEGDDTNVHANTAST